MANQIPKSRVEAVRDTGLSHMNERRWLLQLDCGHDEWITANERPQREYQLCSKCVARAASTGKEE